MVALRLVVAVLGAVTVVMAIGTFILLWTVEEGPAAVPQGANTLTYTWETRREEDEGTTEQKSRNVVYETGGKRNR